MIYGDIVSRVDDSLSSCQLRYPCERHVACEKRVSLWLSEFLGFAYSRTLGKEHIKDCWIASPRWMRRTQPLCLFGNFTPGAFL